MKNFIAAAAALPALWCACSFPDKYNPLLEPRGPLPCGIEIIIPSDTIVEGDSMKAGALLIYTDGKKKPAASASWESLEGDILSIDASGSVTGLRAGRGRICARLDEMTAEEEITVARRIDYTRIWISEIFYDAAGADDGREFIEVYNDNDYRCDLSGLRLSDGSPSSNAFVFPPGSGIDAKGLAVIAQSADGFAGLFSMVPDYSGFTFALNNSGETVMLIKQDGSIIDIVYIKGGSAEMPAPAFWGSAAQPAAPAGSSVLRLNAPDTDTFADWTVGPPSPGRL